MRYEILYQPLVDVDINRKIRLLDLSAELGVEFTFSAYNVQVREELKGQWWRPAH